MVQGGRGEPARRGRCGHRGCRVSDHCRQRRIMEAGAASPAREEVISSSGAMSGGGHPEAAPVAKRVFLA